MSDPTATPKNLQYSQQKHAYHIVDPSPWPLLASLAAGGLAYGAVAVFNDTSLWWKAALGFVAVLAVMCFWFRDIIKEAVVQKAHSANVKLGFRFGMLLFIMSEVMFFLAFFWAFFHHALFPDVSLGGTWPPEDMHLPSAFDLPFLMTMILLLSGCTVTWAHYEIIEGRTKSAVQALFYSVLLGVVFTGFQIYEYTHVAFGFGANDFTSTFYMATGFHGFHVLVGTIFLAVCLWRTHKGHFTADDHFGFEAAAWYWHFVDVVWLFLFVAIYWWGS